MRTVRGMKTRRKRASRLRNAIGFCTNRGFAYTEGMKNQPSQLDDLLERGQSGDRVAFDRFAIEVTPVVRSVVIRAVRIDIDDVIQETFLRLWVGPKFDRSKGSARTFVCMIARRVGVDMMRRRPKLPCVPCEYDVRSVDAPELQHEDVMQYVTSPKVREIFELIARGFSYTKIAGILGIPKTAVKTLSYRHRQRILTLLKDQAA